MLNRARKRLQGNTLQAGLKPRTHEVYNIFWETILHSDLLAPGQGSEQRAVARPWKYLKTLSWPVERALPSQWWLGYIAYPPVDTMLLRLLEI